MVNIAPLNASALKKSSGVSEKKCYGAVFQKELFNFFHSSKVIDFNSFCEMIK